MSAHVKARFLFARELIVDAGNQPRLFDDEVLKKLVERKSDASKQRDAMTRSAIIPLLMAYALALGFSVSIPSFQINIEYKNHLIGLLTCLSCVSLLQVFVLLDTEQAYDGLIDQFIIERSNQKSVDPDLLKAAHQTQFLFLKTLRDRFNIYDKDSLRFKKFGATVTSYTLKYIVSIWGLLFLAIYAAEIYLTFVFIPTDLVGWIMKIVCGACILGAVLIERVPGMEFEFEDDWDQHQHIAQEKGSGS
jgi:hypothetical protein